MQSVFSGRTIMHSSRISNADRNNSDKNLNSADGENDDDGDGCVGGAGIEKNADDLDDDESDDDIERDVTAEVIKPTFRRTNSTSKS